MSSKRVGGHAFFVYIEIYFLWMALLCKTEKCTIFKILLSCTYIGSKSGFYRGFIGGNPYAIYPQKVYDF